MLQRASDSRPTKTTVQIWIRRFVKAALVGCVLFAVGLLVLNSKFKKADEQHALFQSDGESIQAMLSEYAKSYKEYRNDPSAVSRFYSKEFEARNRGRIAVAKEGSLGDATLSNFEAVGNQSMSFDHVDAELKDYFSKIEKVDLCKFKINLIENLNPGRDAILTVKHVLNGVLADGQSFEDRIFIRWHLVQKDYSDNDNKSWKIVSEELISGERTSGNRKAFIQANNSNIGIEFRHQRNPKLDKTRLDSTIKFSVVEHAGGGLAANDFDSDGDVDLLFLDGVSSRLYENRLEQESLGDESSVFFVDVTKSKGLPVDLGAAHSALFFDFDNDGDKDLFVARYLEPCKFYENKNNQFNDVSESIELDFNSTCSSCCVLDYDNDGFLDLYVGCFGNAFEATPDIPFFATNGKPNRLFRNVGGKRFEDVSETAGIGSTGWTLATTAGDFDADGYTDLMVANDFGRKVLYRNNRDGTFTDMAKDAGVLDFSGGMGVSFCDLNGDEYPDLITANIESGTRWFGEEATLWQYMRNTIRGGYIGTDWKSLNKLHGLVGDDWKGLGKQIGEGNSVFLNLGNGEFQEWKDCNANRAGWAWSINAFDYDLDGDVDLYCSNGWVTSKLKDDL